jgi:hypothetical protein
MARQQQLTSKLRPPTGVNLNSYPFTDPVFQNFTCQQNLTQRGLSASGIYACQDSPTATSLANSNMFKYVSAATANVFSLPGLTEGLRGHGV